ncbi:glycosyl hydrolase 115 family protein [Prevotella sp. E13-17]|uniref:glycosyl hydrolase 115 family protein n=1 Tax=Prevotella sp. E13-17 TaxID=2913616 RepID=UPI001EDA76CF|nr:glycosyl hydrolase 115 family protein [Prevotella sp. E13-17]UKK50690.1 glycosyl hydrolase 115 family protein [Prevotella sp. E13-17]
MSKPIITFLAALLLSATMSAQNVTLSKTVVDDGFPIVTADAAAPIVVSDNDAEVVKTVAQCLSDDAKAVTGKSLPVKNQLDAGDLPIIAGTLGQSTIIDQLAATGKIDATMVAGKWEVYGLQLVEQPVEGIARALVVYGSTPRGTAYGLFELSRQMGVSPYVWWADVAPAPSDVLYASGQQTLSKEPSVKYRGIFINDEDFALFPWASKGIDKKYNNIGPNTYARVMELLLRLRANTLWPAMHLCSEAFWANKDNLPVAKKYDIMLGSSHCEQMLRDNEWEWRHAPWNGNNEDWNYVTNKAKIQQYWEERVAESADYDGMYTLGMRGVHDWGISGYPSTEDKVRGLTDIIGYQRELLGKYFDDVTKVPQLFIPYKEVLDAYNAGLQVPEDVTLCWVDDNHGYIRQLPKPAEQARSGGNGVYYHLSYWGSPHDYLWIASHSPSLISYELSRAYDQGIRTLWVINVGDIKPAEMELEFCMDLAWDINSWQPADAYRYNRHWAAETFGEELADRIADIKLEYYRLAAGGKPEHVFDVPFSNAEKDQRIADYQALMQQVDELKGSVPDALQDAYFQLIEYPVKGAGNMNIKTFRAAQSLQLAKQGKRDQALDYAAEARQAFRQIVDLTTYYNKSLAGGKWDGMMSYKPRDLMQFGMPETATLSNINSVEVSAKPEAPVTVIPATQYTASNGTFTTLKGVGVSDQGVTVWPLDMNKYSAAQAPYLEYDVPVKAGKNNISVRCLPTFPINTTYDLRVALSIDGRSAQVKSLKTTAMEGKWNQTVLQGYNDATEAYVADADKTVKVRVSLLDPGVVVSDIYVTLPVVEDNTLTESLIENYDFEYNRDCQLNAAGNIGRGVPCGWNQKGTLKKGANGLDSFGVNQDATNYHGNNVCWFNSVPMPEDFELSQTIPAEKLEPGVYRVTCMLWVENSKKTTCRLFANQNVQYYGTESDYTNLLVPGEVNTYAGYAGGTTENIVLRDMEVYVTVGQGESLTLGIKTSNRKNDGTRASDNAGWFKVDYFHIERVSQAPTPSAEDLSLTKSLIANYDFELYSDNGTVKTNTSGDTRRYTPYGWNIAGQFPGQSYGINKDAANAHGTNVSWCLPQGGHFPEGFELYQEIPAEKLTPGRYLVACKLWVEDGYLATTRLFANQNVQYYGMPIDYRNNLTAGENNTFAGYVGGINGNFLLQDMFVYVDIAEGENLRLGIRADGRQSDGTLHPEQKNGWFKVDYFRIHQVDENNNIINTIQHTKSAVMADTKFYTLGGRRVQHPQRGIYVQQGRKTLK